MKRILAIIALCFAASCSHDKASNAPAVPAPASDVTADFLAKVSGKTYGPNKRYSFTKNGRLHFRSQMPTVFTSDDKGRNGERMGFAGSVSCNYLVDVKIAKVLYTPRRYNWSPGPYELRLEDESANFDPLLPVSDFRLEDKSAFLPTKEDTQNAIELCETRFTADHVIAEFRISKTFMTDFDEQKIQWSEEAR